MSGQVIPQHSLSSRALSINDFNGIPAYVWN